LQRVFCVKEVVIRTYKTLGPVSANLIASLYDKNKVIFTIADVEKITKLEKKQAGNLMSKLIQRKVVNRLKKGKYIIIPQELGTTGKYVGNRYVAAREIVKSPNYYISHYSAMEIYNMLTHPITKIFVTTPKQEYVKNKVINGITLEFIFTNMDLIWGVKNFWITKSEQVRVSNVERTILDCLYKPKYCGGIQEIAAGIWFQKDKIDFRKLASYAFKLNKIVVIKRLGYILEGLGLQNDKYFNALKLKINDKYYPLDPLLGSNNTYKNSWKLIANISHKELKNSIST